MIERRECRIEWVLDRAEIAAGGAGTDRRALDEGDPRAAIGEDGGRRAADDPSTDDDDLGSHPRSIARRMSA